MGFDRDVAQRADGLAACVDIGRHIGADLVHRHHWRDADRVLAAAVFGILGAAHGDRQRRVVHHGVDRSGPIGGDAERTTQVQRAVDYPGLGSGLLLTGQAYAQHAVDHIAQQVLRCVTDGVESQHDADRDTGLDLAGELGRDQRLAVGRDRQVAGDRLRRAADGRGRDVAVGDPGQRAAEHGVGRDHQVQAQVLGSHRADVDRDDRCVLLGRDADIAAYGQGLVLDRGLDVAAQVVADHQPAESGSTVVRCRERSRQPVADVGELAQVDQQPIAGCVEVLARQVGAAARTLVDIGLAGLALHRFPQAGVLEILVVERRRLEVCVSDILVHIAGRATAHAGLEQDPLPGGDRIGLVGGVEVDVGDADAVTDLELALARSVGVADADIVDQRFERQAGLALLALRDGGQRCLGGDARVVAGRHRQAAGIGADAAACAADVGVGQAADHVAGQHKAQRQAFGFGRRRLASTPCGAPCGAPGAAA